MIVVDSSALVAIFEQESDAARFATAIAQSDRLLISAVNVHETGLVLLGRRGRPTVDRLWHFLLHDNGFEIAPFDTFQVRAALHAFEHFGKGRHSGAKLNLADCAAYALAKTRDVPLLFKGSDFTFTDVRSCL